MNNFGQLDSFSNSTLFNATPLPLVKPSFYESPSRYPVHGADTKQNLPPDESPPKPRMRIMANFHMHYIIDQGKSSPGITSHIEPLSNDQALAVQEQRKKKKRKKKRTVIESDNNTESKKECSPNLPIHQLYIQDLIPIGVFWDIENCQIPRWKSAMTVVELIRRKLLVKYREAEFVVVCDIHKERDDVIKELNNTQVTVIHVPCKSKNAADDKLRQCMRRFIDSQGSPCAIILISSDVNFAVDLSDFKNRKKIHVILIHNRFASEALLLCSNQNILFQDLLDEVPSTSPATKEKDAYLNIYNLPRNKSTFQIKQRVEQLMENCGGKMILQQGTRGLIKFSTPEAAQRALLRMDGEDVFGHKISLHYPYRRVTATGTQESILETQMNSTNCKRVFSPFPPPPNPAMVAPPRLLNFNMGSGEKEVLLTLDGLSSTGSPPDSKHVYDTFSRAIVDADGPNRWDYYRTPSEYLVEKTPQGHRRIRGAHKSSLSSKSLNDVEVKGNYCSENRAAYIPFPVVDSRKSSDYKPIYSSNVPYASSSSSCSPSITAPLTSTSIDLHVTNLDQSIGAKEMKNHLTTVFKQHVTVLNVTVHLQSDGHLAAIVRVPSVQDAQYAVSQLHRRKLGNKRIMIAYDHTGSSSGSGRNTPTPIQIRAQVNALLAEIPQRRLPLFKFRELYEQRFHTSVSLADLHRLRDILYVTDDLHGRCVVFLQQQQCNGDSVIRDASSPNMNSTEQPELSVSEMPRCPIHDSILNGGSHGWAEPEPLPELPLVYSTLHQMSLHIHGLLQSHGGSVPLASVPRCFEMEIGHLCVNEDKGVPLEHIISCVKGVGISSVAGHKRLQWAGKNEQVQDNADPLQSLSPSLLPQMSLLCRELVDLLKMAPQCRIPFSKFIPAYHHHFGRQCRVADYGYTRLIDLLEALPHVVQILGEGNRRYVTLSHRAQVKRFTSDLLRILKAQASKQITVAMFATLYEKTLNRPFDPRDYGLCELNDLLAQVAEASVVVMATANGEEIIALPKREQTLDEMERTKQFAIEVIELLKHAPQCKLDFAKFIPAYHHHFGRQCRVADYGFSKLVELFESIPDTVQVFETDNEIEKYVQLTIKQRLKIVSEQVAIIVRHQPGHTLSLAALSDAFRIHYGFALRPEQYDARDLEDLVAKLRSEVQVVYSERGPELTLVDQNALTQAKYRVLRLLYQTLEGSLPLRKLLERYKENYGQECPLNFLAEHMEDIVTVDNESHSEPIVRFVPLQLFARQIHALLHENGGRLPLANFESSYLERFGTTCRPAQYGFSSFLFLLQALPHVVVIRGKGPKRVLILNKDLADLTPPVFPRVPKPSGIKPPAHWLVPQSPKKEETDTDTETDKTDEMYEDLKHLIFNSSSSSSVMYSPMTTFIPSLHWSPMWSMGMTMGMPMNLSAYASNPNYPHAWNISAALPNYPCNFWVTAWPTPCTFSMPLTTAITNMTPTRASVQEIEDSSSVSRVTPPPPSLLPRPSLILTSNCEDEPVKNPVKSRIAAQFRNPCSEQSD